MGKHSRSTNPVIKLNLTSFPYSFENTIIQQIMAIVVKKNMWIVYREAAVVLVAFERWQKHAAIDRKWNMSLINYKPSSGWVPIRKTLPLPPPFPFYPPPPLPLMLLLPPPSIRAVNGVEKCRGNESSVSKKKAPPCVSVEESCFRCWGNSNSTSNHFEIDNGHFQLCPSHECEQ